MVQTLREMKELLAAADLRPKKHLGQHFLHDGNQMRRILDAAQITPLDLVLEVGAGTGALSEGLLDAGAELIAVEIDRDLEPILHERLRSYGPRVSLVAEDVLAGKHRLNPRVLELIGQRPFKLVANLPYQVAAPLLVNLVAYHGGLSRAVVMVQREVAQRLGASPGGKDYGPLSVMVQAMCTIERLANVSASCFWPVPQVESAVLRLRRLDRPATADPDRLSRFVQRLFNRRRKQIGTILGRDAALPGDLDAAVRPEVLTVGQIADLAERFG